jgi:hypothetical protein
MADDAAVPGLPQPPGRRFSRYSKAISDPCYPLFISWRVKCDGFKGITIQGTSEGVNGGGGALQFQKRRPSASLVFNIRRDTMLQ